ncbi:hypothetical protein I3843_11G096400 [Carya illinoinensis]|nr:hypothetical protein I3843_11G096400 [Carya illinoinensis]
MHIYTKEKYSYHVGYCVFLGLKRTYRLALKIQRKVISPKHPKIRQFLHRRTRAVFNVAVKVHHNIQERDIEVGRNVGNWILRWLDRMKPSAQIRGPCPGEPSDGARSGLRMTKQVDNSNLKPPVRTKHRENRILEGICLLHREIFFQSLFQPFQ